MDLGDRQVEGEAVGGKNVRRHDNDLLRQSQLFAPDVRIEVAPRIAQGLNRFLDGIGADRTIAPKSVGINSSVAEMVESIAQTCGLNGRRAT
jgi:hypothetical protein